MYDIIYADTFNYLIIILIYILKYICFSIPISILVNNINF